MRKIYFIILLLVCLQLGAQNNKFSVSINFRPELTFYRDSIAFRWKQHIRRQSFNIGIETTIQYNFIKNFFVETGIGLVYRSYNTQIFFNQNIIPPPRQSLTQELVIATHPSYGVI